MYMYDSLVLSAREYINVQFMIRTSSNSKFYGAKIVHSKYQEDKLDTENSLCRLGGRRFRDESTNDIL